jgi:hypothetical protein
MLFNNVENTQAINELASALEMSRHGITFAMLK